MPSKFSTLLSLSLVCLLFCQASAQDFSNKGKDFWVGYGYHVRYVSGNPINGQEMVLYFATDAITNVRVEIPALGYVQNYNIPANTIFTTNPLPKSGSQDARLTAEGVSNKGVHIVADRAIVAYAHIYNGSVSGATLLFPTNTLGKEYFSINYEQKSNEGASNCFFYAVATDTGTTTIEVIPTANTQGMIAGNTYTFNLTQGQVFNAMGTLSGNNGVDLTGTKIRSISSGTGGCKRIAVFSGSGKIYINCATGQPSSADNYMVQAFPKEAWGKYYLTVPTQNFANNFYRIAVSDPTTVVKLNGTVLGGLVNNFYYQLGPLNSANLIEADKPIMVAQYISTQGACGNGNNGDPEVIYLSPVEQNIDKVVLNSTPNFAISQHFINVVIPNRGTGVSSFRIDGNVPSASFVTHPQSPNYSYLQLPVGAGQHIIQSDSGFNAVAYGYGPAESYGYNAGANIKDLYQFVSVQNQYATVDFPAACKSSPFYFSITFPYQPTQIKWSFNGLFTDVTQTAPVFDSSWTVNGKTLYRYKIATPYTINNIGTYPIKVIAQNPTPEGCSGEQEIIYDLQVFERPVANFSFINNGCVTDNVSFTDISNTGGRPAIRYSWNFDDGATATTKNTSHLFTTPGTYNVKFSVITDIGCLSDTISKPITLILPPVAKFGVSSPTCISKAITFTDSSLIVGGVITKWIWNFGDGSAQVVANNNSPQVRTYTTAGSFNVTLQVETATGCASTVFTKTITISANPVVGFNFGNACLPVGLMQFTNTSTIAGGNTAGLLYQWNFDDGGMSNATSPAHNYAAAGPYNVKLIVTSATGCTDSITRPVNTIFAQPVAAFSVPAQICLGDSIAFTENSTAPNSTVVDWQWNFGDGNTSTQQRPTHTYSAAGTYYVTLQVFSNEQCVSTVATDTVLVNSLPLANFSVAGPICETKTIGFVNAATSASGNIIQWIWNFADGSPTVIAATGVTQSHIFDSARTYNTSLQVLTDRGCTSLVVVKPTIVHPQPRPGFILPDNCLSDPFSQFTDTSSITDGSQASFTYLWNFGDGNATAANPNTSSQKNPRHKYSVTGLYDVKLTVTSNNGCVADTTQQLSVNGTLPQSGFVVNGGNQHCSNKSISITNNSGVDVGNIVRLEIFWDYANDITNKTTLIRPAPGVVIPHTYPEFFTPFSTTKDVRVVAYSGDNCFNTTQQTIILMASPQIQFDTIPPVCADRSPFTITQASVVNLLPGNGVYSGAGISGNNLFNPAVAGVGRHLIRYTFTGTNGCTNFKEMHVVVFPVPTVTAGADKFVLEGGNVQLNGLATGSGLNYLWTPNVALSNPTIAQPMASPADDVTYTLRVTSANGCTAADDVFVKVLKAPSIPNVFSPNGDGVNDRWEIKHLESYPGVTVEIYNRYGQAVFVSKGYGKAWDGTYKGAALPAGTYYYIINPKNGRKQVAGFVDIIR